MVPPASSSTLKPLPEQYVPLTPRSPEKASQNPKPILNIQFYIIAAHGLPEPHGGRNKRFVRAACSSKRDRTYSTNASLTFSWGDNTAQIGPIIGTDKITFSVELHAPLVSKHFAKTIATSASYNVDTLLELQAKEHGDKSISIPLTVRGKHVEGAHLVLLVKQPTSDFISRLVQEEVERHAAEREEEEKEYKENKGLVSETGLEPAPTHLGPARWRTQEERRSVIKGKQREVQKDSSKLPVG